MPPSRLVMATRRSALALAQARAFARLLEARVPGLRVEELLVVTSGDKATDVPLTRIGGKGLFTKEIEDALADRRADFAVHSFKDVPAKLPPGFAIACVPERADPRDALVSRGGVRLADLRGGAKVGTSSLRRALQLRAARPDLDVLPLRGNVDTRLRKLDEGQYDAVVVAAAGLGRLGLSARVTEPLDPGAFVPAAGQGALGVECRIDDERTRATLAVLHDAETAVAVACERAVMARVEGNCTVPFGSHAWRESAGMRVVAMLARDDGSDARRAERRAAWPADEDEAERVGAAVGDELIGR